MSNHSHLTPCGLPGIDRIPVGMHSCHFYSSRQELIAALVPYMIAGLEANERCIWITAPPLPAREAEQALRAAWDGVDEALRTEALRILDFDRWYVTPGGLKDEEFVDLWLDEETRALAAGHSGLRISGNASFLTPDDWSRSIVYERTVTERLANRRIVALCSYPVADCDGRKMSEVIDAHHCAFGRTDDDWQVIAPLATR